MRCFECAASESRPIRQIISSSFIITWVWVDLSTILPHSSMKQVRRPQGRTTRCAVALSALRTPRYNVPVIPQRTAVLRTPCRLPFRLPDPFMANAPTRTGKVDGTRSHRRLAASLAARTCCFPAISSRMMTREVVLVGGASARSNRKSCRSPILFSCSAPRVHLPAWSRFRARSTLV